MWNLQRLEEQQAAVNQNGSTSALTAAGAARTFASVPNFVQNVELASTVQEGGSVALVFAGSTDDGGATSWDVNTGDGEPDTFFSIPAPSPDNPNPTVEIDYTFAADEGASFQVTAKVYDDYNPCGGQQDDTPYDATPQTIDITDAPITFQDSGSAEITEGDGNDWIYLGSISDQGNDPPGEPTYTGTITWGDGGTSAAIFSGAAVYGTHGFDEGAL